MRISDWSSDVCSSDLQKHTKPGMPKAIRSIMVPEEGGEAPYVAIDDAEGLISLVQFGALELHPWGSREGRLEQPDRLVFDLDPDPGVPWERVRSEEHTSELQSLMRISYAVFCLQKKTTDV